MKCLSCDRILSDREATRKYASSGAYLELCDKCYDSIKDQVATVENEMLSEDSYDDLAERFLLKYEQEREAKEPHEKY